MCDPNLPNGSTRVVIVRKDGVEAKTLGHELMHTFGLNHIDEYADCAYLCYDTDPHTKAPLMCSSGTGDWYFTDCDRPCLAILFDGTKCACLQIIHPGFPSDFTCPAGPGNISFSIQADNPSPVINCKTDGDIVTLTITLLNNNTAANRNITAFVNATDEQFVEFLPNSGSDFNCIKQFPGIRTEFKITDPVNQACSNEVLFPLQAQETKSVTLKFKYKGGINFGGSVNTFKIQVYTGSWPPNSSTQKSITITPFVQRGAGVTNIWSTINPVSVTGQLTINTGVPIVLGLNPNGTLNNINNKLLFTSGSGLEVNGANTLKLVHAQVEGCDNMWKGITVKQGGTLEMTTMTSIKDAQYAVNVQRGGSLKATDCLFFNNNYAIRTAPEGTGNYNITIL